MSGFQGVETALVISSLGEAGEHILQTLGSVRVESMRVCMHVCVYVHVHNTCKC